jgi:LCP family protein required for cell wall assembly
VPRVVPGKAGATQQPRAERAVPPKARRTPKPRGEQGVPRVVPGRVPRTPAQRAARILKRVAAGLAVVVLVASCGMWLAFRHYNAQINRIAIPTIGGVDKPAKGPHGGENFLLVGSDNREGANAEGTGFVAGQRSDTVILVHLYENSENVELVSFPRDSWVEIPSYTSPKTGKTRSAHESKLNSAYSEGGPALLIATLEHLTDVRIDHYLQLDFTGFKRMVNKVGGVDVCLTKSAVDSFSGIHLSAGHHHIDGDVALAFVRQRHGLAQGDIDRIARQQQFIGSLANKVLSKGTLLDPFKLTGFLDAATSSLKIDDQLKTGDLKKLALRLRHFSSNGVLFTTVPVKNANARRSGQSVVLLDDAKATAMFQALHDDRVPGAIASAKPSTKPKTVTPSAVHVSVFNGSDVAGLGRRAASDLANAGFKVVGTASNRGTGATQTTIRFGPSRAVAARTLQAALPGSSLVPDPSLTGTLEVVVGSSYASSHPTAGPTHATSSADPGTSAPVKTAENNPCTR